MMRFVLSVLVISISTVVVAQDFKIGFTTGMSLNKFDSEGETDDSGVVLETFDWNSGFHVGATFTWKPTELMGVRGEFQFSQKGGRRAFDGPSYYWFTNPKGTRIHTTGTRKIDIDVSNSYLSLPVMAYFRPFKWIEFYAGGSLGFLVSSSAFGELTYEGKAPNGSAIQKFTHEIDANYFADVPLKMSFASPAASVQVGSEKIFIPQAAGAYFEFTEDRGNLYKVMDLGVIGGVSIYLNRSLYISLRANKGMTDLTKTKADVSLINLDADKQFISRPDKDKSLSLQVALGFSL